MRSGKTCANCAELKVRAEISHSRIEKLMVTKVGGGLSLGDLINPNEFDSSELCANPYCERGRREIASRLREVNDGLEIVGDTGNWRPVDGVELDRLRDLTEQATEIVEQCDLDPEKATQMRDYWDMHINDYKQELLNNFHEARKYEILLRNMPFSFLPWSSRLGDVKTVVENLEAIEQQL